ncbi:hypothetical protein [Leifsonia sp. EB41]|uniref:hypothetical protein n=1 Tax=Leifsonia sp. EB41 TaxID=3156260 RepID=UPI0035118F30
MDIEEPDARSLGVSDEEAVSLCRDWMLHLGALDTVVASGESRDICDLFSGRYLAWVDNTRGNLDGEKVMFAAGVASRDGRQPIIFKRGGIRLEAQRQADLHGVALFYYAPSDGVLEGANILGHQLRASHLSDH